jgi:hypothetical protein
MYQKPEIETQVVKPKLTTKFEEKEYRFISEENEKNLDNAVKDLENFMAFNHGLGKSETEKDELYLKAKSLWEVYVNHFRSTTMKFFLSESQFEYFTEILRDKIEYDINTIFFGIELTDTLGKWVTESSSKKSKEVKSYDIDPVSANYLYHLISTVKVKGLTEEAYLFSQVLRKIHEVIKVVNFYDNHAKTLSKEIQDWVASFEPQQPSYGQFGQPNFGQFA